MLSPSTWCTLEDLCLFQFGFQFMFVCDTGTSLCIRLPRDIFGTSRYVVPYGYFVGLHWSFFFVVL